MFTVGVGTRRTKNTDYDAAQALLDLQSNKTPEKNSSTYADWRDSESKEDIEKAAKLILSCFITTDDQTKTNPNLDGTIGQSNHFPVPTNILLNNAKSFQSRVTEPHKMSAKSHEINVYKTTTSNKKTPSDTRRESNSYYSQTGRNRYYRDAGTQTEDQYINPKILLMETTIKNLCDRIKSLESQLKTSHDEASFETADQELDFSYENNDQDPDIEMTVNDTDTANESKYSRTSDLDGLACNSSHNHQTNKNVLYNGILTNYNKNSHDLVPLGDGNATVPSRLLKQINWNSYSSATRKLLTAVFSRRILATHSLTGKPSPAFPNKPAKKRLDPSLVNDIVQTVVERCHVPENIVRTSITTKCADESKMFRTREKNKKKRSNKNNRENISPSSDSESDDY